MTLPISPAHRLGLRNGSDGSALSHESTGALGRRAANASASRGSNEAASVAAVLEMIPRLSRRVKWELGDQFQTVEQLLRAEAADLVALRGVGPEVARRVLDAARQAAQPRDD